MIENLLRSIPDSLALNLDISKIRILKIFKWIKKNNISDEEMINTFNCGVGFCIITPKKNIKKNHKCFSKNYKPYEIGHISKNKKRINLTNFLQWEK